MSVVVLLADPSIAVTSLIFIPNFIGPMPPGAIKRDDEKPAPGVAGNAGVPVDEIGADGGVILAISLSK